jgi:hypothetical protein
MDSAPGHWRQEPMPGGGSWFGLGPWALRKDDPDRQQLATGPCGGRSWWAGAWPLARLVSRASRHRRLGVAASCSAWYLSLFSCIVRARSQPRALRCTVGPARDPGMPSGRSRGRHEAVARGLAGMAGVTSLGGCGSSVPTMPNGPIELIGECADRTTPASAFRGAPDRANRRHMRDAEREQRDDASGDVHGSIRKQSTVSDPVIRSRRARPHERPR